MKKNLYYFSLLLGLVFGMTMFTACGGDDGDGGGTTETEPQIYSILRASKWYDKNKDVTVTSYGGSISSEDYFLYFLQDNQGYLYWSSREHDTSLGNSSNNGWVSFKYYSTSDNSVRLTSFSNGSSDMTLTYSNGSLISDGGSTYQRMDITNDDEIHAYLRILGLQASAKTACPDGNHPHLIDLNLPSGTLWACCNIGTNKPEGYGYFYAWGETQTKNTYNLTTYQYYNNSSNSYVNIGDEIAGTQYDVATAKWGSNWRMPSLAELQELFENDAEWTTQNGVNGVKIVGTNGGTLFLPAAGYSADNGPSSVGSYGHYWSSSRKYGDLKFAYSIEFSEPIYSSGIQVHGGVYGEYWRRFVGMNVRPVCNY